MKKPVFLLLSMCLCLNFLSAQTLTKEAMNNFARYTHKAELSSLEQARKNIDDAYKTRKDSLNYRINLIRGLVYSSLAYADSNRTLKYVKDPIDEALFALDRLKNPKQNEIHDPEIKFIRKQLSNAWLQKAQLALKNYKYAEAYNSYLWVDSFSVDKYFSKHNLGVLSEKLGYTDKAIESYHYLIQDKERSTPDYYLALSNLYEELQNSNKALAVINEGRRVFPGNKDLLFKEINILAENGSYEAVTKLAEEALEIAPENLNLMYLAGFSFEMTGNKNRAREYYEKIISFEPNNYEGNYALGLLYLTSYLTGKDKGLLNNVKKYLVKASEINPNAVNVLKSLIILYTHTGNTVELQKVKNKLSQIILN